MTALTLTVTLSSVMTSWGGTSRVTVRRSILTRRSMPKGMISLSPGPLRAIRRPSRKRTRGQQTGNHAYHAGQHQTGMRHPEADADDGEQEEKVDEVRIGHSLQQLVEPAHVVADQGRAGGLQGVAAAALVQLT